MFRIIFKGKMEDMYLSDAEGAILADDIAEGKVHGYLKLKDFVVDVGAIKAVLPHASDPDSKKTQEQHTEKIAQYERDWQAWKKRRLAMTPKDRAQTTGFMNYICQAIRGRAFTAEEIPKVRIAQEKWFTEHPDFHSANPVCYFGRDEISRLQAKNRKIPGEAISIGKLLPTNALAFAERHLNS